MMSNTTFYRNCLIVFVIWNLREEFFSNLQCTIIITCHKHLNFLYNLAYYLFFADVQLQGVTARVTWPETTRRTGVFPVVLAPTRPKKPCWRKATKGKVRNLSSKPQHNIVVLLLLLFLEKIFQLVGLWVVRESHIWLPNSNAMWGSKDASGLTSQTCYFPSKGPKCVCCLPN